jgi:hypothetical protein
MKTIIISAMFSRNDGATAETVGAAHKALAEFAREIPGVKVCRYGLNEANRTSSVYAVYDSPQALKELFDALVTRGSSIMAAETKVTTLIPGQTLIQGDKTTLDEVSGVIEGWGLSRFHTDTQGGAHIAI